jgi:hypothetical protein
MMAVEASRSMVISSRHVLAALLLACATPGFAQPGGRSPTADINARAASDAAQALDMAASPSGQPAPLLRPDGKLEQSGSNTSGLYDRHNKLSDTDKRSTFDPNRIHYPYGRASIGTIDPNSAANPYGPYGGGLPSSSYRAPPAGVFHGGLPAGRR